MKSSFEPNLKQVEALKLLGNDKKYTLLYGGGGSGKSVACCVSLVTRAIGIPNSTHGVFRNTGVSLKNSLFNDTFRKVLRMFTDDRGKPLIDACKFNITDMEIEFPNGSKILFGGLDNDERIERLLGMEYSTVYVNECSEIKSFKPMSILIVRLRQVLPTVSGAPCRRKFILDCNPPTKSHWAYKLFFQNVQPETGQPLGNPADFQSLAMNTIDNVAVLGEEYVEQMKSTLTFREQRRFIHGEWLNDNEDALFSGETIDRYRVVLPENSVEAAAEIERLRKSLSRIVVAVDPSTTSTTSSDEHGIIVAGCDAEGDAYVLEDASFKGSPQALADRVSELFNRWGADLVVAERNQGGDMVEHVLRTGGYPNLPVKLVFSFRGKQLRAEPIAAPYEKGHVHHVGRFKKLEDQMESFTLDYNRRKQGSPDRLDALVFALTELMLGKVHAPSAVHVGKVRGFF